MLSIPGGFALLPLGDTNVLGAFDYILLPEINCNNAP
jgi:hypothetical protein